MDLRLKGRRAIVTGGSSGIGFMTARQFLEEGARVLITGRNADKLANARDDLAGSKRPPLTEQQRRQKPPVSHPVFLTHPITGRKVLYADPGYTMRIDGMPEDESDEILSFLFAHQIEPEYQYQHLWNEGDLMMWDNIGTLHTAIADYGPHQLRLMQRRQVMADRIFAQPLAGAA